MNKIAVLSPELIDEIFAYLNDSDIYTCLRVSHQFHRHAIPFLYRNIELSAYTTLYNIWNVFNIPYFR